MATARIPLIEIMIRDEVSAALERSQKRMRSMDTRVAFPNTLRWFQSIGQAVFGLQRELNALAGVAGIGGLFGGGFIASIARVSQGLGELARSSIQARYSASGLNLTVEQINRLVVRGQALGMTAQESRAAVERLASKLQELQVLGRNASTYKELEKGIGGKQFGDELIKTLRGPGGIEAAIRLFAERTGGMVNASQRHLADVFGFGTVGIRDMFKFSAGELRDLLELPGPAARRLALAQTNLNTSYANLKTTLAAALIPSFEKLATTLDRYLQGPGGKIVKQFADWFSKLNINWNDIAKRFTEAVDWLAWLFKKVKAAFDILDPIVQDMGGWKTIIGGLAVVLGVGGLAGWLTNIARGFTGLLRFAPLIVLIGGIAMVLKPTAAAGAAGGVPMPKPRPPSAPGGQIPGSMPQRSGAASGMPGGLMPGVQLASFRPASGGGYYGGNGDGGDVEGTDRTRDQVRELGTEATKLANFITSQALLTDASGAGGLAGFYGAITGGRGGGGGGGGGGVPRRAPAGGGGGGGGGPRRRAPPVDARRGPAPPPPPPLREGERPKSDDPMIQAIIDERAVVMDQMRDPSIRSLVAATLAHEMHEKEGRADVLESLVNRAVVLIREGRDPRGIVQRLITGGFYGPYTTTGKVQAMIRRGVPKWAYDDFDYAFAGVLAGRNEIGGRNDQGRRREVGGPGVIAITRSGQTEYYAYHSKGRGPTKAELAIAASLEARRRTRPPPTSENPRPPDQTSPTTQPQQGAWPSPVTGQTGGPGAQIGAPRPSYPGRRAGPHQGLDIFAPEGEPVSAQLKGTIEGNPYLSKSAAGNVVVIRYSNGFQVKYFHLSAFAINPRTGKPYKHGDSVEPGDVVGYVGKTGAGGRPLRTAPHLHYEVRDANGNLINPNAVLGIPGKTGDVPLVRGGAGETERQRKNREADDEFNNWLKRQSSQGSAGALQGAWTATKDAAMNVKIVVRGPRGVRTTTGDNTKGVTTTIERAITPSQDPTGGGQIQSPA